MVLAVVSLIAVPAFRSTVVHSAGDVSANNVSEVAGDAVSIATGEHVSPLTADIVATALHEVEPTWTSVASTAAAPQASTGPTVLSYDVVDEAAATPPAAGLAVEVALGGCAYALVAGNHVIDWYGATTPADQCTGTVALAGPPVAGASTTTTTAPTTTTTVIAAAAQPLQAPNPVIVENQTSGTSTTLTFGWTQVTGGSGGTSYVWSMAPSTPQCTSGTTTSLSVTCTDTTPGNDYVFSVYAVDSNGDTTSVTSVSAQQQPSSSGSNPGTTTTTAPPTTTTTGPSGAIDGAPLGLLGGSANCSGASPILTESGNASVVSGSGNAPTYVNAPCAHSIVISGSSTLSTSQIDTANPNLDTYCFSYSATKVKCLSSQPGPTEVYAPATGSPYANLTAPVDPGTQPSVSCSPSSTVTACPAGQYSTTPTLGANVQSGVTFAAGTTVFDSLVQTTSDSVVTFAGGTYWFKDGLVINNASDVTFGPGTYIFGSGTGSGCLSSTCLDVTNGASLSSPSGALLYVAAGKATFQNNGKVSLHGDSSYDGLVLWDAAANGTTDPLTISNSGALSNVVGGVYVPNGEAVLTGVGSITAQTIIVQSAALANSGSMTIGS